MLVEQEQQQHLTRLAEELVKHEFRAELSTKGRQPNLKVINPDAPSLNERVLWGQAADGSRCYWWPWRQPIGSVDDLESVIGKIMAVLRSVEGEQ